MILSILGFESIIVHNDSYPSWEDVTTTLTFDPVGETFCQSRQGVKL